MGKVAICTERNRKGKGKVMEEKWNAEKKGGEGEEKIGAHTNERGLTDDGLDEYKERCVGGNYIGGKGGKGE